MFDVFMSPQSEDSTAEDDEQNTASAEVSAVGKDEVVAFLTNCSHCNSPTETRMKLVGILISS